MHLTHRHRILASLLGLIVIMALSMSHARNPIRNAFFDLYPDALGTQLDDLPSNSGHCGVCHFNFDGGGARNPYGLGVEIGLGGGLTNTEACLAIEGNDSDTDGFTNFVEITDLINFGNTPTFPGLSAGNVGNTLNIPLGEIEPYLTPSGGADTTAPAVTILAPNGGEILAAGDVEPVSFDAFDESGISHINVLLSDDGGILWHPVALRADADSPYEWFVPNRPTLTGRIRIEAVDNAGNAGHDDSDANFEIVARPPGSVPSTLRDVDLSGTQPHEGAILEDPSACATCHGNYDPNVEAWFNWGGSMMAQAMRDPLFLACMAVAEQDAPSVGDICIRCHTPGGWQEGRSVDTSGGMVTLKDRAGVQCDFCHREVDHDYVPGVSPAEDQAVLAGIDPLPLQYGNGQFINDPAPLRRGPYADAQSSHAFVESPMHRTSHMCGVCHDVSNPVFVGNGPLDYVPNAFDEEHPDMDVRNMAPVERTFSEWSVSEYATTGVYAPQFAGNKPDGIVSTCEDCHMRDVQGAGCNDPEAPVREDLGLHDLTGGNTFIPDVLPDLWPGEVDEAQLNGAIERAEHMLELAATLEAWSESYGLTVSVTNETGHKLPSGYPEGRRIWLNVQGYDSGGALIYESGQYDAQSALLIHDDQIKVYEIHPGLSPGLAGALGFDPGPSFHFVLSDTVYSDNRIPPRGYTAANFLAVQSPTVAYEYADGQYWDATSYTLPAESDSAFITLYYQTTTREYVEFLRDANTTNNTGQILHDAWVAQGMSPPVAMAEIGIPLEITSSVEPEAGGAEFAFALHPSSLSPTDEGAVIRYTLSEDAPVDLAIYDLHGRRVRNLVNAREATGHHEVHWDGRTQGGTPLAAGVYFVRCEAGAQLAWRKVTLLR